MNPKTVVILVLLLAIAGAILLAPQFMTPSGGPHYDTSQDIPAVPIDFLDSGLITIHIPTQDGAISLEKRNGKWWVKLPHEFPANTQKVNRFLQQISGISVTPPGKPIGDEVPNPPQPVYLAKADNYCLIRPIRRMGAGRSIIEVTIDDDQFQYNANDTLHQLLEGITAAQYFATSPASLLMPDVTRIEFLVDGKTSTLRQIDAKWWVGAPENLVPALEQGLPDAIGVSTYIEFHNSLEFKEQESYPLTDSGLAGFGLDRPLIKVVYHTNDNQSWTIKVGVPADQEDKTRYVSYGPNESQYPAVFKLDTPTALALAQDAKVFRDPRVTTIPTSLIESMSIKNLTGHYTIRFMANGIQFVTSGPDFTPDVAPKKTSEGQKLAEVLSAVRAIDFIDQDSTGLKAIASITVTPKLDGNPEILVVYPDETDQTALVKINNEKRLRRVSRSSIQMLIDKDFLKSE